MNERTLGRVRIRKKRAICVADPWRKKNQGEEKSLKCIILAFQTFDFFRRSEFVFFSQKYFQTAIYLSNCFVLKLGNIDIDVKGRRIFKHCCCCY